LKAWDLSEARRAELLTRVTEAIVTVRYGRWVGGKKGKRSKRRAEGGKVIIMGMGLKDLKKSAG
jgi:hypothetical protein